MCRSETDYQIIHFIRNLIYEKHRHLEVRKSITYILPGYNLATFFLLSYFSKVEVKALLDRVVKSGIFSKVWAGMYADYSVRRKYVVIPPLNSLRWSSESVLINLAV